MKTKKSLLVIIFISTLCSCDTFTSSSLLSYLDTSSSVSSEQEIQVKVKLDAKGGYLDEDEISLVYDEAYFLPVPSSREEMGDVSFLGWYYQGEKVEIQGEHFPFSSSITLEAKWESADFEFRLSGNTYTLISCKTKHREVNVPSLYNGLKVTRISSSCFQYDSVLTSLSLPNTIEQIDDDAFYHCSSLQSISFHKGVKSIGISAFEECSKFKRVYFYGEIEDFLNISFSSYSNPCSNKATLYLNGQMIENINIPSSISEIPDFAFSGVTNLKEVVLGENITKIGQSAFEECTQLKKINLPSSIKTIEESAFSSCYQLENITFPSDIKEIEYATFKRCYKLKRVIFNAEITSILDSAFESCTSLEEIDLPSKVKEVGSKAFYQCLKVQSLTLSSSLEKISSSAFSFCTSLTSLTLGKNVTNIAYGAFSTCVNLEEIQVDNENETYEVKNNCLIKKDEKEVVLGCKTSVLEEGITSIGNQAFFGMNKLEEIYFPSSLVKISDYAFSNCSSLSELVITKNITSIGNNAFTGCSNIASILVDDENQMYSAMGNCLLTKDKKNLIYGCKNSIIPNVVEMINKEAFYYCSELEEITIPANVKYIQENAFSHCYSLKTINISDGVLSLGDNCFSYDTDLENISLPNTITSVPSFCFSRCYSLKDIIVKEGVETIEDNAFEYCTNLKSLTLPKSLNEIMEGCFIYDRNLMNITIDSENADFIYMNNQLLDIKKEKLYYAYGSVSFVDSIKEILPYALYGNDRMTNLVLPSSLEKISYDAFAYMPYLESVKLPKDIKSIEDSAFEGDSLLSVVEYDGTKDKFLTIDFGYSIFKDTKVYEVTCQDSIITLSKRYFN